MRYAMGVLLVILLAVGGLYAMELKQHGETKQKLEQSEVDRKAFEKATADAEIARIKLNAKNKAAELELSQVKRNLERLKNRQHIYIAKPELVTKLINKDFKADEKRLACITGDTNACE